MEELKEVTSDELLEEEKEARGREGRRGRVAYDNVVRGDAGGEGGVELHFAVATGREEVVSELLESSKDPQRLVESTTTEDGRTVLHIACSLGHLEVVRLLLKYGANPNRPTVKYGLTPLHLAAIKGHDEVIRCLSTHSGAGLDFWKATDTRTQHTALHLAALNGRLEAFRLILDLMKSHVAEGDVPPFTHPKRKPLLLRFPRSRRKRSSSRRHDARFDGLYNLRASDGSTLLHCAVAGTLLTTEEEEEEEEEERTEHGSPEEGQPSSSIPPQSNPEGVKLLRELLLLGADSLLTTRKGWTPLHLASALGSEASCRRLLGLDLDLQPSDSEHNEATQDSKSSSKRRQRKWKKSRRKLLKKRTRTKLRAFDIARLHRHSHLFTLLDPSASMSPPSPPGSTPELLL